MFFVLALCFSFEFCSLLVQLYQLVMSRECLGSVCLIVIAGDDEPFIDICKVGHGRRSGSAEFVGLGSVNVSSIGLFSDELIIVGLASIDLICNGLISNEIISEKTSFKSLISKR